MTDSSTDLLSAALRYAALGLPVFPCSLEKKPMTTHGHHDATTDPGSIRAMFAPPGVAGIGVPTGPASGWLVIDRDRHGDVDGIAACHALEQELGPLAPTRHQRTGSGGDQLIYRYPADRRVPCSAGRIAQGVDVRGDGGYIVVPPSRNERGPYTWIRDTEPVDLPTLWLDRLAARPRPERAPVPAVQV
ncbi:MAG: bifunctional DNA primase/polymerase, partial [Deltaproteobacteria bacterium]|nr:bifunctional DNA primase/polymerase [Deltaproteobacteria bacterium]